MLWVRQIFNYFLEEQKKNYSQRVYESTYEVRVGKIEKKRTETKV